MAKISGLFVEKWIPAFAGMTEKCLNYRFFSSLLGDKVAVTPFKTRAPDSPLSAIKPSEAVNQV